MNKIRKVQFYSPAVILSVANFLPETAEQDEDDDEEEEEEDDSDERGQLVMLW